MGAGNGLRLNGNYRRLIMSRQSDSNLNHLFQKIIWMDNVDLAMFHEAFIIRLTGLRDEAVLRVCRSARVRAVIGGPLPIIFDECTSSQGRGLLGLAFVHTLTQV